MTTHGSDRGGTGEPARRVPDTGLKALLQLAAPILVAQFAVMAMGLIDTIMAGQVSADDLAAVALGAAAYGSVYVGGMGVMQALTPIAGHHFGAGRHREIGIDLEQTQWLGLGASALGVSVLLSAGWWLPMLGASERVTQLAHGYLVATACGLPAALATRGFVALNSAVSRPHVTLVIQLTALACKVPLNLVLMHGFGPLPALGAVGCGVGTALLSWLTLLLAWVAWRLDPGFAPFRDRGTGRPVWSRQRELLRLGLPSSGSLLIEVTSFTFMTLLLARLGSTTLGAHQIAVNLVSLLFMVPLALGVASSVLVAQALGAGSPREARAVAWRGMRIAVVTALALAGVVWWLRVQLVTTYSADPEVVSLALSLIGAAMLFHVLDAVQGVAGFVLRGYKVAAAPMIVHGITLWGVGLLGGWWLAYRAPPPWGGAGALSFWFAAIAGLVLAAAALSYLVHRVARLRIEEAVTTQERGWSTPSAGSAS